jgi:hypothetical protein
VSYLNFAIQFLMANRLPDFWQWLQGQGQSVKSGGQSSAEEPPSFIASLSEEAQRERSVELARRQDLIEKMKQNQYRLLRQAEASGSGGRHAQGPDDSSPVV